MFFVGLGIFQIPKPLKSSQLSHLSMKVVVLCGGEGVRLKPLTDDIPKPLVQIRGKPLLEHVVSHFRKNGYSDFVFAIGYKGDRIRDYFRDRKDIKAAFVDSGNASIIQRIADAAKTISGMFMVVYGDTIADVDIRQLLKFHGSHDGQVTVTTYPMQSPFGLVFADASGKITEFKEKPVLDYWMNIGFMAVEKKALTYFEKEDTLMSFFDRLIRKGMLYEYKHKGKHITVNTEKEKADAEKQLDDFYTD